MENQFKEWRKLWPRRKKRRTHLCSSGTWLLPKQVDNDKPQVGCTLPRSGSRGGTRPGKIVKTNQKPWKINQKHEIQPKTMKSQGEPLQLLQKPGSQGFPPHCFYPSRRLLRTQEGSPCSHQAGHSRAYKQPGQISKDLKEILQSLVRQIWQPEPAWI